MGYNYSTLNKLRKIIEQNSLTHPRIIDVGAQDFFFCKDRELDTSAIRGIVSLTDDGCSGTSDTHSTNIEKLFHGRADSIPMQDILEAAGMEYICCDIESRVKALSVDLNFNQDLTTFGSLADICTNHGNSEHIMNQSHTFKMMLDLTKQDAFMWHIIPMGGLYNHGYVNLTPKFWVGLVAHNKYEVIDFRVSTNRKASIENPNDYSVAFEGIEGFDDVMASARSHSIELLVRKTHDPPWIPPIDINHMKFDAETLANIYLSLISQFYDPNVFGEKIAEAITDLMARRQKDVRVVYRSGSDFDIVPRAL